MRTTQRRQRGITFVEAAAYLAAVSVLLGSGLPSLVEARQARQLESLVSELRTDIQLARSAAVSMGQSVRLQVQSSEIGACYIVHTGPASSCSCQPASGGTCTADGSLLKAGTVPKSDKLTLTANTRVFTFDGTQGTVTPTGTLTAANAHGDQLKLIVNVMGRTRSCRSAGDLAGHPRC